MTAKFIIMVLVLAYIMVIIAISIYLIKIICTRYNQNSDQILPPPNMHSIQESASMHLVRIGQLPHPGPGYCYYELGGQDLTLAYTKDMQKQSLIIGMINMRLESTEKEITN